MSSQADLKAINQIAYPSERGLDLFSIHRPNTDNLFTYLLKFLMLAACLALSACQSVPWPKPNRSADADNPLTTKTKIATRKTDSSSSTTSGGKNQQIASPSTSTSQNSTSPTTGSHTPSVNELAAFPSPINLASKNIASKNMASKNKSSALTQSNQAKKTRFSPEDDLLDRIRSGYAMDLSSNHPDVRKQREFYLEHQDYLNQVLERATPYLYHIVEQIEQRGMPLELAYLPIVESAYNVLAYSRSGAAGLWQFITSTGKFYGLKQTAWYDGRRDVIASSEAALDYLQKLYLKFDDWQLALAAYNGGEGTVGRALKANKTQGKGDDFWSIGLSAETTQYVPKMIALAQLLQDPNYYRANFIFIPNRPYFAVQQLAHQIDLATISLVLDTSLEELARLNPGFKKGVSDPHGPHRLVVPINKKGLLAEKLAELSAPKQQPAPPKKSANKTKINTYNNTIATASKKATSNATAAKTITPTKNYRVQSGDSLYDIARRHNINVKDLAQWNALKEHGSIRPGQTLWLESYR